MPEFQNHYYQEKAKYVIKAFTKDLKNKIEEVGPNKNERYSTELTLFQIVSQDLHCTIFFKAI